MNKTSDDPDTPHNWATLQEALQSRHKTLADTFHALSLGAAFGSLFLLISLEELLPPQSSDCVSALWWAWSLSYLSCVMGSIHLWLEMMFPLRMIGLTAGMPEPNEVWTEDRILARVAKKQLQYRWYGIPCFLHMMLLIGVFVSAAIYRFSNL